MVYNFSFDKVNEGMLLCSNVGVVPVSLITCARFRKKNFCL